MTEGKSVQAGNEGKPLVPGKTENLSSVSHVEGDAGDPNDTLKPKPAADREPDIVKDQ